MPSKLFYRGPSLAELHRDYAKQSRVDSKAPLVSASTIEVRAPILTVWNAVADVEAWPRWAARVDVLNVASVQPDARFKWKLNGIRIDATFAVVKAPTELSWTGRFFWYRAVDRNVLESLDANRTLVTFEESLAGPLLTLFYTPAQLRANHDRWLASLKTLIEVMRSSTR